MLDTILEFVQTLGLPDNLTFGIAVACACLAVLALAYLAYLIMRYVIVATLVRAITRSKSKRDDIFVQMKVFSRLSHAAPVAVIYALGPSVFASFLRPCRASKRRA